MSSSKSEPASSNKQIRNSKIVGGTLAANNEFPFIVSLQMVSPTATSTTHFCGGSLIAANIVLTAGMLLMIHVD